MDIYFLYALVGFLVVMPPTVKDIAEGSMYDITDWSVMICAFLFWPAALFLLWFRVMYFDE